MPLRKTNATKTFYRDNGEYNRMRERMKFKNFTSSHSKAHNRLLSYSSNKLNCSAEPLADGGREDSLSSSSGLAKPT